MYSGMASTRFGSMNWLMIRSPAPSAMTISATAVLSTTTRCGALAMVTGFPQAVTVRG